MSKIYSLLVRAFILPITFFSLTPLIRADHFVVLDSIQSQHGIYYTTMSPQGNYLAMGDQASPGAGVDIIDITNPGDLTLTANIPTGHMTYELDWKGDFIYCPASWDGLYIYDVSHFNNIVLAYDSSFGSPMTSVIVKNHTALVGCDAGMYAFDVSNPYHPTVVSHHPEIVYFNAAAGDTIAYAFQVYEYALFINIADPGNPRLISTFACPDIMSLDVDEARDLMFIATQGGVVKIYDISDILHPSLRGSLSLPVGAGGFDVDCSNSVPGVIVVSGLGRGIYAVDVTDPSTPLVTANWPTPIQSHYVLLYKGIVYNTSPNVLYSLTLDTGIQSVDDNTVKPSEFNLSQNYPNPFNPTTSIEFSLPQDGHTVLEIYNTLGQKIATLLDSYQAAGVHSIVWDAAGYPSGKYFYKLRSGNVSARRGMVFVK